MRAAWWWAASLRLVCTSYSLQVALHAQSRYSDHGWVAGSEVTTAGLLSALRRHPSVDHAALFAPFAYAGLFNSTWDVLIIEGWTGPVPKVIHEVRARCPRVRVLYWCLDTYPSLATVMQLDVDGYMTNSRVLVTTLGNIAPTLFLPLAADLNGACPCVGFYKLC